MSGIYICNAVNMHGTCNMHCGIVIYYLHNFPEISDIIHDHTGHVFRYNKVQRLTRYLNTMAYLLEIWKFSGSHTHCYILPSWLPSNYRIITSPKFTNWIQDHTDHSVRYTKLWLTCTRISLWALWYTLWISKNFHQILILVVFYLHDFLQFFFFLTEYSIIQAMKVDTPRHNWPGAKKILWHNSLNLVISNKS